jgi:hypothetical protein
MSTWKVGRSGSWYSDDPRVTASSSLQSWAATDAKLTQDCRFSLTSTATKVVDKISVNEEHSDVFDSENNECLYSVGCFVDTVSPASIIWTKLLQLWWGRLFSSFRVFDEG